MKLVLPENPKQSVVERIQKSFSLLEDSDFTREEIQIVVNFLESLDQRIFDNNWLTPSWAWFCFGAFKIGIPFQGKQIPSYNSWTSGGVLEEEWNTLGVAFARAWKSPVSFFDLPPVYLSLENGRIGMSRSPSESARVVWGYERPGVSNLPHVSNGFSPFSYGNRSNGEKCDFAVVRYTDDKRGGFYSEWHEAVINSFV